MECNTETNKWGGKKKKEFYRRILEISQIFQRDSSSLDYKKKMCLIYFKSIFITKFQDQMLTLLIGQYFHVMFLTI